MAPFLQFDWQPEKGWFGDSIVILKSIEKLSYIDTSGLSIEEQRIIIEQSLQETKKYGERIHFDSLGNIEYSNFEYCRTGGNAYDIKSIKIENNELFVQYNIRRWNDIEVNYVEKYYLIDELTFDKVVLKEKFHH